MPKTQSFAAVPAGFAETVLTSTDLPKPTAFRIAPDGRVFICLQDGSLVIYKDGAVLPTPFLTVSTVSNSERGLLGVELDPNFPTQPYVYIYYTTPLPAIHNRVSRFTADGDVALAGSEIVLLELNDVGSASHHNGGCLRFGADGKLYIATGDNRTTANSQSLSTLFGKILRINPDGAIPSDNPFYNAATDDNRAIWALGLRNPFSFDIQSGTGRVLINDVGEGAWEEINEGSAGANFGWPNCEGACAAATPGLTDPLLAYPHNSNPGGGYAVTGGAFYNPSSPNFPANYFGGFFYADYVLGWIRFLDLEGGNVSSSFATSLARPVALDVGPDGKLFCLSRGPTGSSSGVLRAIEFVGIDAPTLLQHPAHQTVLAGSPVTFSVMAASTSSLAYQWKRGNDIIPGATESTYTIPWVVAADQSALFRCIVSNTYGSVESNPAQLTVVLGGAPLGQILTPATDTLYSAGDVIQFQGAGSDVEDGILPESAFSWVIDFHHDTHTHPFLGPITGASSGSFSIPTNGELSPHVWYRIYLTVTDSAGQTHTSYVDVIPKTVTIQFQTSPPGLELNLNGQPVVTPEEWEGVVGIELEIGAPSSQTLNGITYTFSNWSDGGAIQHTIAYPQTPTIFTANYTASPLPAPTSISSNDGVYTDRVRTTWNNVANATHYRLYRSTTSGNLGSPITDWIDSFSFDDTTGTPGVLYYYSVQAAADATGTAAGANSPQDSGWRALAAPVATASDSTFTDRVRVQWSAVPGATHYRVAFATTPTGSKTYISSWTTSLTFDHLSGTSGVTYYYFVIAAVSSTGTRPSKFSAADAGTKGPQTTVITVAATDNLATEPSADTGRFTFTRTGSTSGNLVVTFSVSGTAISGTDYSSIGTTIAFVAGQSTVTKTITPVDDTLDEPDETVVVSLNPGAGYTLGSSSTATVVLRDND